MLPPQPWKPPVTDKPAKKQKPAWADLSADLRALIVTIAGAVIGGILVVMVVS